MRVHVTVDRQGVLPDDFRVRGTDTGALVRSIERRTRLTVAAGPCSQGWESMGWGKGRQHWSMTLGRAARGGGYTPVCEVWVRVENED